MHHKQTRNHDAFTDTNSFLTWISKQKRGQFNREIQMLNIQKAKSYKTWGEITIEGIKKAYLIWKDYVEVILKLNSAYPQVKGKENWQCK